MCIRDRCHACIGQNVAAVQFLFTRFEFDASGMYTVDGHGSGMPLHFAIRANNEALLRTILPYTKKMDQQDGDLRTCLHLAVLHGGNDSHVRTLLRCGASPDIQDRHGLTSLGLAEALEPARPDLVEAFHNPGVRVWNLSRRAARAFEGREYGTALRLFNAAADCGMEALADELSPTAVGLLFKNRAEVALLAETKQHAVAVESCAVALERLTKGTPEYRSLLAIRASSSLELCDFGTAVEDYEELTVQESDIDEMEQWCSKAQQAKLLRDASMYDVLCVPELEEEAGIKKAFHKLSKKWHPDKHMMNDDAKIRSTRMFQRVSDAYRVLSDSHRRMEYDAELALKRCEVESDLNDISFSSDLNFTNEDGDFTPRDYQWYMSQMHEPYFESFLNVNDSDDDYAWN
eukprot:TRINITY_DN5124_c0_g1_i2.p1 TRINITY_DN5124_c0_g1~~TRINITY_DN5124_c0_g1_i2.p1  ORF type:complete len:404 (-),score=113.35 TRINITY_DN5124_c0_g1_i2:301-1512(-)